jgi:preprotein translocase subunit SecG
MEYFVLAVILVVCVLLGAVILVQNPKGGGLATGFQSVGQIGGVQRTTNFLEKATWTLTGVLFVLCIGYGALIGDDADGVGVEAPTPTTAPAPAPVGLDAGNDTGQ